MSNNDNDNDYYKCNDSHNNNNNNNNQMQTWIMNDKAITFYKWNWQTNKKELWVTKK